MYADFFLPPRDRSKKADKPRKTKQVRFADEDKEEKKEDTNDTSNDTKQPRNLFDDEEQEVDGM
jgi:hypothetical protein